MSELSVEMPASNFSSDTHLVMSRLQEGLRNALGFHVGGAEKIRNIQDRFGLNFPLSWKLYRIANAENQLEGCPHVPVAMAMKRVCTSLTQAGVSPELVAALQAAFEEFEQHVITYGGDRTTFDGMVAQLVGGDTERELELEHRKSLFEAERFVGGVEQELYLSTQILYPSENAEHIDVMSLRTYHNLRRLNPSKPLIIDARRVHPGGAFSENSASVPVDVEAAAKYGIPLLPNFCSCTDLPLMTEKSPSGFLKTLWMSEAVGRPSTVTVAFGEVFQKARLRAAGTFTPYVLFSVPAKLYVRDILVYRETFSTMTHVTTRWRNPIEARDIQERSEQGLENAGYTKLACREQLTYLGNAAGAARMSEAPRYEEMLRSSLTRTRFELEDFSVYRLRMEYPLMYSMLFSRCQFGK